MSRRTGAVTTVLALLSVAAFLVIAIGPRIFAYRTVTELSGSMSPGIRTGDLLVDVAGPASAVRAGQVISFKAPTPGHPVVTHRVIEVQHRNGHVLVRTKGDANNAADPWLARIDDQTVWRVRMVVPLVGTVIRALHRPVLHLVALYAVPGLLLGWLLAGVWRRPAVAQHAR